MSVLIKGMEMPDCCFHCVCSDNGCGITGDFLTTEEMRERPDWCPLEELPKCEDAVSRKWLLEAVEEGWIKFDTEEDYNRYIHLVRDIAPSVTPEPKTGKWIEDAETYYKAVNEKDGGVDENTPLFMDDIACPKCLAMFSVIDNCTETFNFCPHCGADMRGE